MKSAIVGAALLVITLAMPPVAVQAAWAPEDTEEANGWNCVRKVELPDLRNVYRTDWSPDGLKLAFVRIVRVPSELHRSGYQELEILETLDLISGHVRYLGEGSRPAWSPSGRFLAFWGFEADYLQVHDGERVRAFLTPSTPEYKWVGDTLVYIDGSTIRTWSEDEPGTIRKFDFKEIPHYPTDDLYWSGDGSRFTVTTYDPARPEPQRRIGTTSGGSLEPLDLPGALITEWSPSGAQLLVRYSGRLELRDASGATVFQAAPGSAVHQWGPDGQSLLLWNARPFTAGADAFVDVPVVWPRAATAKLPNLGSPRQFSPNGRHFSGIARSGLHEGSLVVYRCLNLPAPTQPDATMTAAQQGLAAAKGRLLRPLQGPISQFMEQGHTGLDVTSPLGSPIVAADDGVVRAAGWVTGGGYRVCLKHAAGLETCYFHTAAIIVGVGQRVVRGQPIALVGVSGLSRGPHVHFEARFLGRLVDPLTR